MVDKKILRLLIIDDSPDDAELAIATLRKAGYMLKSQRVQDLTSTQAALEKSGWDIVLSETTLTHFGAAMALDLLKRLNQSIPLIAFTRAVTETDVAKIMRAGGLDVVRKDEAFRLGLVIERELRVADERREWHTMAQKLSELEGKHRAVVDNAREAIGYCQDGMHVDANATYLELFGYSKSDLEGLPVMNLIEKADQPRFKEYLRKGSRDTQEFLALKKDGSKVNIELAASPITFNNEPGLQIVVADISKRKAAENRLQYLNQHDPLTGLYNRQYFLQALNDALEKVHKGGPPCGILYIDLTQIKAVNEEFGHAAGDRMLLKVARVFRDRLGDQTLLARFGGDEFAVLLHSATEEQLAVTAKNLQLTLKETSFSEGGKTFNLQCNCGTAVVGKETSDTQKLLANVYRAAQQARSKSATALAPTPALTAAPTPASAATLTQASASTAAPPRPASAAAPTPAPIPTPDPTPATSASKPATQATTTASTTPTKPATADKDIAEPPKAEPRRPAARPVVSGEWPTRIQAALDNNGFRLAYQPIVNLHGEPAEYFEVLVRLVGADGKTVSAGEFMSAAEKSGFGSAIDRWVIQHAIEALNELHRQDRRATFFINLCPGSFSEPDLIVQTQKLLWAANTKPEYLSFEADEEAILAAPGEARALMQAIKKLGCRFTVDNFGNNMSNLNQLRDLPLDCLKIAGSHIRNLSSDNVAQASLKALVQVARALDKKVIAKSVERAEDLAVLWNLGVDYVQGHYFQEADSRPSYDFGGETTLSSELTTPQWAGR